MIFDVIVENILKQQEFDFNPPKPIKQTPKWINLLGNKWDLSFKQRYYPILNMRKGKGRDAAFKKFWIDVINELTKGKSVVTSQYLVDIGIPEYIVHRNRD